MSAARYACVSTSQLRMLPLSPPPPSPPLPKVSLKYAGEDE